MNNINNFLIKEPVWREVSRWSLHSIPHNVLDWLLEPQSLTTRIKDTFTEPFVVQVQAQGLSKPFLTDAKYLQQSPHHYALIREVLLSVGEQPIVFARTTLPKKTAHNLQELTHLGTKSLGEIIFGYPDLQRVSLDIAKVKACQLTTRIQNILNGQKQVWARRNTYKIKKSSFIVSEFFLPFCMQHDDST